MIIRRGLTERISSIKGFERADLRYSVTVSMGCGAAAIPG